MTEHEQLTSELIKDTRYLAVSQTPQYEFAVVDINHADYAFWDRLRRGKAKGLELAASFVKAIGSKKSAWVLGKPPIWETTNHDLTDRLNTWWRDHHPDILRGYNESVDLGDCYLVLNADLSITVVPPHMVTRIVDERDYLTPRGWRIRYLAPYPNGGTDWEIKRRYQKVEYEYYDTHIRKSTYTADNKRVRYERFDNPSGRNPVIPIRNKRGADEENGRPECEPFLPIFTRYTDVLDTALKGNLRQGRPTPTIKKMGTIQQVEAFWRMFGRTRKQMNPDTGQIEDITVIPFDPDVLMTLGGDAEFSYESPGSFSADTETLLSILFKNIIEGSEIPEFVWGGAIGSSKASAESQLEPFVKWILKQRGEAMTWISQLTETVLAFIAVYDPSARGIEPSVQWRPIAAADGRLVLDSAIYAYSKRVIDDETLLYLLPLGIDDPRTVLDKANAQEWDDTVPQTSTNSTGGEQGEGGFTYVDPVAPTERQ